MEQEYVLGTDSREYERLRIQHETWSRQTSELMDRISLAAGMRVLDLGCGPGYTTFALAERVGPAGEVLAVDESPRFLEQLQSAARAAGLDQITSLEKRIEELEPGSPPLDAPFDAAYSRWLFSWLPDVELALGQVSACLRPGGRLAAHEYLDWATLKLVPRSPAFDRGIEACMRSWEVAGGQIDVAEQLLELAPRCSLELESFEPIARSGVPGSEVWHWLGTFFTSYLPRLVQRGLLGEEERLAFLAEWQRREEEGQGVVLAPLMSAVVLRRT